MSQKKILPSNKKLSNKRAPTKRSPTQRSPTKRLPTKRSPAKRSTSGKSPNKARSLSGSGTGQSRILVTAALPYVNNVPHLGTIVPIISADAYARFLRLMEEDMIFVCGTDEHGTTTEVKAMEEGLTPRQICEKYFELQKGIYDWFECSFDCFGGSSSKENKDITLDIFSKLDKNKGIVEQTLQQLYCTLCKRFLADRFVGGTCPHCGYEEARGDQCENCGKLLEASELKAPLCRICKKSTPIIKDTRHIFIDLPKLEGPLRAWMNNVKPRWTPNAITMTDAWLKEGLKPRCITRDLQWGISVPKKGFETKVFYSWFDAPIAYIGITAQCRKDWKDWWLSPSTVRLVQFMGKDNIPFHTILFPAFLIGTKDPWTLVTDLSVNEFLNLEGGLQFSKSRGIGVFGDNARDSGIPADVWRYHLMINRPEKSDTEFSWKDLQSKANDELCGNFGNLVNRVLTFIERYYGSVVDKIKPEAEDLRFIREVESQEENVKLLMQEIRLKEALKEIMHISKLANQYFQIQEPWKSMKTHPVKASTTLGILVNVVKDLSIVASPFMPATCEKIRHQLNICDKPLTWKDLGLKTIKEGHRINGPEILFKKLDDDTMQALAAKLGFSKKTFPLNLRVAKIHSIEPHPNADKLYIIQIDVGNQEKRQIVAGLRPYYSPAELLGRHIIIVANLQPAMLRGVESQGMLLAGEKDGKVRILEAPKSKPGEAAMFGGMPGNEQMILYEEFSKILIEIVGKKAIIPHQGVQGVALKTSTEEVICDVGDHAKVK